MAIDDIAPTPVQDVFANTPAVSPDAGNALFEGWKENIDGVINGIIERIGELGAAGAMAAIGKTVETTGNAVGAVASVGQAPFQEGFISPASPGREEAPSPSHGLGKELQVESPSVEASYASLGGLTPDATPSQGRSQGAVKGR